MGKRGLVMHRNQNRHLKTYAILGFIFVAALGTLLHFTFEWSNQNRIVAFFSAVNESMWEHLKLLVFPFHWPLMKALIRSWTLFSE